jgi:beclin 1
MLKSIIQSIDTEIAQAESDENSYIALCSALEEEAHNDKGLVERFESEISEYNKEIEALSENLNSIESERANLRIEAQGLEKEAAQLDEQEAKYWADVAIFRQRQNTFEQERDESLAKVAAKEQAIEQLSQSVLEHEVRDRPSFCQSITPGSLLTTYIPPFSQVFKIELTDDCHFGTINGYRLGRLPELPVDWSEINVAWGLAALLLETITRESSGKFSYSRHKEVLPIGSASVMRLLPPGATDDAANLAGERGAG